MKVIKYILDCIISPFEAIAVLMDEHKQLEGHGDWDKAPAKKNRGR